MSNQNLFRLVYVSRNELAGSPEEVQKEIDNILKTARENNPKIGVTGALLFNAGCFAQVLEGPQEEVETLFEQIQEDERHSNCLVLDCQPASSRNFSKWSMAYQGQDTEAKQRFSKLINGDFTVESFASGDRIFSLIVDHINQAEQGDSQ